MLVLNFKPRRPIRTWEGPRVAFEKHGEDKMTLGDNFMLQVPEDCTEKTHRIFLTQISLQKHTNTHAMAEFGQGSRSRLWRSKFEGIWDPSLSLWKFCKRPLEVGILRRFHDVCSLYLYKISVELIEPQGVNRVVWDVQSTLYNC